MSKYKIIGDYTTHDNCAKTTGDTITVRIPFTFESCSLKYGISNVLNTLKQKDIYPTEDSFDIVALAALVYLADTRISRKRHAEDSWTREIALELPVYNPENWLLISVCL